MRSLSAFAVGPGLFYQGRILQSDLTPVTGVVQFRVQLRSPGAEDCLLWEEIQSHDLTGKNGTFVLGINDGSGTRTDGGIYTISQVLANNQLLTLGAGKCASGTTYSPTFADGRSLAVSFNDGSFAGWEDAPVQAMNYAPKAVDALQVSGVPISSLVRVIEGDGTLNSVTPLSQTQYSALLALMSGSSNQYVPSSTSGGASLPLLSADPTSPPAGKIWFDSANGALKYSNGSAIQTVGASGATLSSITAGTGLTGGTITTTGTIALESVVTAGSGTKINFDTFGRVTGASALAEADLPTLSTAGKVSGSALTSGTIGGSTAIGTSGAISTSAEVSSPNIRVRDSGNHYASIVVPNTLASNYTLTLPPALGSANQVLTTDASGALSWTTPTAGMITSISFTSPITNSGTATAPHINVSAATTSSSGVVTLAVNGATTPTTVIQANDSRLSDSRVPSGSATGDLSGAYPNPSVGKIQGTAVSSSAPTTAGQVLRYNGTSQYAPSFIGIDDIRSTLAGNAQMFPTTCSSAQTLTYSGITDTYSCTNITYASQSNNTLLANVSGSATAPTATTLSNLIDNAVTNTQGSLLYRDATGWTSLSPGTSGQYLQTQGAAANPQWATQVSSQWTSSGSDIHFNAGKVGIGTSSPSTTLDINGQVKGGFVSHSSLNTNWASGNIQTTSVAAGTLTFSSGSMFNGASYTLILTSAGTFTLDTTGDIATWRCLPTCGSNQITSSGHTILTILKAGTTGYVSWIAGF